MLHAMCLASFLGSSYHWDNKKLLSVYTPLPVCVVLVCWISTKEASTSSHTSIYCASKCENEYNKSILINFVLCWQVVHDPDPSSESWREVVALLAAVAVVLRWHATSIQTNAFFVNWIELTARIQNKWNQAAATQCMWCLFGCSQSRVQIAEDGYWHHGSLIDLSKRRQR